MSWSSVSAADPLATLLAAACVLFLDLLAAVYRAGGTVTHPSQLVGLCAATRLALVLFGAHYVVLAECIIFLAHGSLLARAAARACYPPPPPPLAALIWRLQ